MKETHKTTEHKAAAKSSTGCCATDKTKAKASIKAESKKCGK
jgi:hypothetical protein